MIAVCNEINCPELVEKIALLGHDLAIPSHVVESELLDNNTSKITEKYVQRSTIQILKKNTVEEIQEFRKDFLGLGLGNVTRCWHTRNYGMLEKGFIAF